MISHTHKFIFIHVPKTGGTSVQNILKDYSSNKIIIYPSQAESNKAHDSFINRFEVQSEDPKFKISKHTMLNGYYKQWKEEYDDIDNYFKFGIIRNPWDRAISYYFWFNRYNVNFDKKQFIDTLIPNCCCDFFHIISENIYKFDYLIRFETLQDNFNVVCDKIGIPPQQLPHANKTKHKHYTEYYDDETRQIVAEKYAKDINMFGYKFGE